MVAIHEGYWRRKWEEWNAGGSDVVETPTKTVLGRLTPRRGRPPWYDEYLEWLKERGKRSVINLYGRRRNA